MEDISDLFKKHFNLLHKGTAVHKSVQDRKEDHDNARKAKRETQALLRRNIDKNLSPVNSPTPKKNLAGRNKNRNELTSKEAPKDNQSLNTTKTGGTSKRLELLHKWKADKLKRKEQEKAHAKPIFKVYHVASDLTGDIENANKVIKGKPIVPGSASKKSQFAPPNHKFKPPRGIKPLCFNTSKSESQTVAFSTTSNRFRTTPQKKTNSDLVVRKPTNASFSKGVSKLETSRAKPVATLKETKEKIPKCDSKKNNKEVLKPATVKFIKDKGDGLKEREVKKKPVATPPADPKISRRNNIKPEKKQTNNNPSDQTASKKTTPLPSRQETKSSMRTSSVKMNKSKIPKSPKKTVGWSVAKNVSGSRTSDPSRITFRKTPKKTSGASHNAQIDSKTEDLNATPEKNNSNSPDKLSSVETAEIVTVDSKEDLVNTDGSNSSLPSEGKIDRKVTGSSSSISTDYSIDYNNQTSPIVSECKTPPPPVYISPFVTISRGKDSARKEYKIRASQGKEDFDKQSLNLSKILTAHTSPKAGAAYFKRKLGLEIKRLTKICEDWDVYLNDPELPEDAHSSIDVAIGQSRLLMSKKFQQFRGLIDQCETEDYESKPVTCADLHGFWDMIYMQVEDLDKRFANLQKLKDNRWEEILPQKVAPVKRTRGRPKKAQTKSKLAQIIQEAKKKQRGQPNEDVKIVECRVNDVKTPVKELAPEEPNSHKRKSLRVSILNKENKPRCSSSPGLMMMKISQSIKTGDGLTPARSILKSDVYKSTGKKSVVFKEIVEDSPKQLRKTNLFSDELETSKCNLRDRPQSDGIKNLNELDQDKENLAESLISFSPPHLTPRRSSRIHKLKL